MTSEKHPLAYVVLGLMALLIASSSEGVFAAVEAGRWQPSIGDPTIYGWLTVAAYFFAGGVAWLKAARAKKGELFWIGLAIFLIFLGLNKQLDLQTLLTQTLRDMAIQHGWYERRHEAQKLFLMMMAASMLFALIGLRVYLKASWGQHSVVWTGVVLLFGFILIRAASFHHFDILINSDLAGLRMNVLLELGAIGVIIWGMLHEQDSFQTPAAPSHVEIYTGEPAVCPKCKTRTVTPPVNGRIFKCRTCKQVFQVFIK